MDDDAQQQLAHQLELENRQYEEELHNLIWLNINLKCYMWELKDVREKIKSYKEKEKEIMYMISEEMKDKEMICDQKSGEIVATYKTQIRKYLDTNRLKHEFPLVYKCCMKELNIRTFLIKQKGETNDTNSQD